MDYRFDDYSFRSEFIKRPIITARNGIGKRSQISKRLFLGEFFTYYYIVRPTVKAKYVLTPRRRIHRITPLDQSYFLFSRLALFSFFDFFPSL